MLKRSNISEVKNKTHKTDIKPLILDLFFSPVAVPVATVAYLHIQDLQSNIIIHLESRLCALGEYKSNIHSLLVPFVTVH